MKYCSKCVLSDNFFSVNIGEDGLCNYCRQHKLEDSEVKNIEDLSNFQREGNNGYDVVLAYSGGKDSTYTLYLLKNKYRLNVLAVTFDNGFLASKTYSNIKNVCSTLNVDNLIIAPSSFKLNRLFRYANDESKLPLKSLERASAICTYCIALVKMSVYKEAIMREIPYIAFGWTPGQINIRKQIVKLDYSMVSANFSRIRDNILKNLGEEYSSILLMDDFIEKNKQNMPSLFYPFTSNEYNEGEIIEEISKLGWERNIGTDSNSTNCLLNSYAICKHKEKYGFHPYALEMANLVRNNLLDRQEALNRLNEKQDEEIIRHIDEKLNG